MESIATTMATPAKAENPELVHAGKIEVCGRPMEFWLPEGVTPESIGVTTVEETKEREPMLSA
jgi:hypothetical protein